MRIKLAIFIVVLAACLTTLSAPLPVEAQESARRDVRFYKVNRQIQASKIRFTAKKAPFAGCHNFVKRARIHKAVQIGYSSCRVFADKDCAAESVVAVAREAKDLEVNDSKTRNSGTKADDSQADDLETDNPEADDLEAEYMETDSDDSQADTVVPTVRATTHTLSEGVGWYPVSEHPRGVKLRSWSCSLTEPAQEPVVPPSEVILEDDNELAEQ